MIYGQCAWTVLCSVYRVGVLTRVASVLPPLCVFGAAEETVKTSIMERDQTRWQHELLLVDESETVRG